MHNRIYYLYKYLLSCYYIKGITRRSKAVVDGLRDLYMDKILPIEKSSNFSAFHPNGIEIRDCEWEARPQVLLIGQYSTGKTSFIRHLLGGQDFPGMHIGPVSI